MISPAVFSFHIKVASSYIRQDLFGPMFGAPSSLTVAIQPNCAVQAPSLTGFNIKSFIASVNLAIIITPYS